jgi:hypothetical protein
VNSWFLRLGARGANEGPQSDFDEDSSTRSWRRSLSSTITGALVCVTGRVKSLENDTVCHPTA